MNWGDREDRIVAAGEYVLGTLDPEARAQLDARMATDSALQAEMYLWQDRLLPFASRVAPAEPDTGLWTAIAARMSPQGNAFAEAPGESAMRSVATKSTAGRPAANDPVWRRLWRWQLTGGLGIFASVVLAMLLVFRQPAVEPQRFLTMLQAPDTQRTGWLVEATAGRRIRLVPVGTNDPVPAGKSLQFWTKPQDAAGPTSLGLVRPGTPVELPASRSPPLGEQQLFELTLEPEGGSPTGLPTGPIVFVGRSIRL